MLVSHMSMKALTSFWDIFSRFDIGVLAHVEAQDLGFVTLDQLYGILDTLVGRHVGASVTPGSELWFFWDSEIEKLLALNLCLSIDATESYDKSNFDLLQFRRLTA